MYDAIIDLGNTDLQYNMLRLKLNMKMCPKLPKTKQTELNMI